MIFRKKGTIDLVVFKKYLIFPIAVLIWVLLSPTGCGLKNDVKNVILISVDTLRSDELGCYGKIPSITPFMDSLAARGTVFENMTAAAPWTLPSHASMLTGQYPFSHRAVAFNRAIDPKVFFLPEFLSTRGYATSGFVDHVYVGAKFGFDRGMGKFVEMRNLLAPEVLGAAKTWLKDQKNPSFCFIHLFDPHIPYDPPAEFRNEASKLCPENVSERYLKQVQLNPTEENRACLRSLYRGEIKSVDSALSDFFAWLDKSKMAENTLIILTSDHGEGFLEHGLFLHGNSIYQELLSVPMIMVGPGIPKGRRISRPVSHVDIVPTILSWLTLSKPDGLAGVDVFDKIALPRRKAVMGMNFDESFAAVAVVNGRYKYMNVPQIIIGNTVLDDALFDLESDPGESKNIIEEMTGKSETLKKEIGKFSGLVERDAYIVGNRGAESMQTTKATFTFDTNQMYGCIPILFRPTNENRAAIGYEPSRISAGADNCSLTFTPKTTPDKFMAVPKSSQAKGMMQFYSTSGAAAVTSQGSMEAVFPLESKEEIALGDNGFYVIQDTVFTLEPSLDADQDNNRVLLDAQSKKQLKALGYLH